jgi:hypothetical protein
MLHHSVENPIARLAFGSADRYVCLSVMMSIYVWRELLSVYIPEGSLAVPPQ